MPPLTEALEPSTIIDISHESLMRSWRRLDGWVDDEAEAASRFRRLAQSAAMFARDELGLMSDPELSITLSWWDQLRPNATWASRYGGEFEPAASFLAASRHKRERLKRWKQVCGVTALAATLSMLIWYAWHKQAQVATAEEATDAAQATADALSAQRALRELEEATNIVSLLAIERKDLHRPEQEKAELDLRLTTAEARVKAATNDFIKGFDLSSEHATRAARPVQPHGSDVGVGGQTVWSIDRDGQIFREELQMPAPLFGAVAERISVDPNGLAWVALKNKHIFQRTESGWRSVPGSATDIAVGADGTVGIIETERDSSVVARWDINHQRWDRGAWPWTGGRDKLAAIAIDPKGNPWIVTVEGSIWRYAQSKWQVVRGVATDIAIGADGAVVIVGLKALKGGFAVYLWGADKLWHPVQDGFDAPRAGFRVAMQSEDSIVLVWPAPGHCYWMMQDGSRWEPFEDMKLADCYKADSCSSKDGPGKPSTGGCYKWAADPWAERETWAELGCPCL
jgi:hypothetical protein